MKNETMDKLKGIINDEIKEGESTICSKKYYKNQMLRYAMKNHTLLPCIIRTYIEQLVTAAKYGFSKNAALDLKHANCLLRFLVIYTNKKQLKLISRTYADFFESLPNQMDKDGNFRHSHIIPEKHSRLKSFLSVENNIRKSLLEIDVYKNIIKNVTKFFPELLADTQKEICAFLKEKINNLTVDNILSDILGYRFVVYSVGSSTEEEILIQELYKIQEDLDTYLDEKGFGTILIKDYIKDPKINKNGDEYKALHSKADIQTWTVETQLRTFRMHEEAENGAVAHKNYKDTPIYRFLKNYLSEISSKTGKTNRNRLIGLTQEIQIGNLLLISETEERIPLTQIEVEDFEDFKFLRKIFSN